MSRKRANRPVAASLEALEPRVLLSGSVVISEFMAKNTSGLKDQDGDNSDWIELYNSGTAAVNLNGYYLTDDAANLTKWKLPEATLNAGSYIVIFASGKDRKVSGQELHTNFSLATSGEYLALVEPNGSTIDSQYSPNFPAQYPDVSYGLVNLDSATTLLQSTDASRWHIPTGPADDAAWMTSGFNDTAWTVGKAAIGFDTDVTTVTTPQTLLDYGATAYALVPTSDIGTTWHNPSFTPTGWVSGTTGVGYEKSTGYESVIGLNVASMYNTQQSCYIRVDFNCPDPSTITALTLSLRVDDGAVVWLNGNATPIESIYAPDTLAWNSGATTQPSDPTGYTDYDITPYIGQLVAGRNVLAIQGLNYGTGSSDFLVIPKITATVTTTTSDFGPLIQTNVQGALKDVNSTAYTRIPFNVADPTALKSLILNMKYDDGFVAYINGTQVARKNAPAALSYNSSATAEQDDEQATQDDSFDITPYLSLLHSGTNVLAIQAMNLTASDTDFLMSPTLVAKVSSTGTLEERYFQVPTPGTANSVGVNEMGPIVTYVNHSPQVPADADPLAVTASVAKASSAITSVTLHYCVNWNTETTLTMYDDGAHGDGPAGDGVYGAVIPASASAPSQMVRWYVTATDSASHTTRMPLYLDPLNSEKYYGTVVSDPNIHTNVPVFQFFLQSPSAADTTTGTRGSVFFMGELYDNVNVRKRGNTINSVKSGWTGGLSRKVDMNSDHHFLYDPAQKRVGEINLNLAGPQDFSYLRNNMSYELYDDIGAAAPESDMWHIQQNGAYLGTRVFFEQTNTDMLTREGLDPDGALYRVVYNTLTSTGGIEKKTRTTESYSDLTTFEAGISESNVNRHTYVMDNLDLPALVDYLVADAIMQNTDCVEHNYYVYRDTNGTGEWRFLPYDRDLTWGDPVGNAWGNYPYSVNMGAYVNINPMYPDSDANNSNRGFNRLTDAIKDDPIAKEMFFRRMRTVMDALLKAPGTPYAQLPLENRLDWWASQLSYENAAGQLPYQSESGTFTSGVAEFKSYLAHQRTYLYGGGIPFFTLDAAQPAAFAQQITIGTIESDPASGNQAQEYIQLNNPNSYSVDISGWHLSSGVDYTFPDGTVIVAGGSLYVSPDPAAFRARTTGPRGGQGLFVEGPYSGSLDNHGETVRLVTAANLLIDSKSYGGDSPLVNEVMTNNGGAGDWIELFNPTASAVDLSGWYLSDSATTLTKFPIPSGTTIAPGGYLVFTEAQFGTGFALSKNGESVYLSNPASLVIDAHDFGGSDSGVTFGRYVTNEGIETFTTLATPTMGGPNSGPLVGPVVINEIMYSPLAGKDEFVELRNITTSPVKLYDVAAPAHTWTVTGGVDYTFPTGVEMPAQGLLVLTGADVSTQALKDAFRAKYNIPSAVDIFGPWQGKLDDAGEGISLNKVGPVDTMDGTYPTIRVDRVEYGATYPWPSAADGTGKSLERTGPSSFGNDPFSWLARHNGNPGYQGVLAADANLDDKIDFRDYIVLESNFNKTGQLFTQGDFNGDGAVTFKDYIILEATFGGTFVPPAPPADSSTPSTESPSVATLSASLSSSTLSLLPSASTGSALPAISWPKAKRWQMPPVKGLALSPVVDVLNLTTARAI